MSNRLWFQTKVFWGYTIQYLKSKLAYRLDFFLEAFTEVFHHAANLLIILILFNQVPLLKGYSKEQLIFIYGFFLIPYGIFSAFFGNLYQIPEKYILQGELDRILIRPINKLLQVIMETMTLEDLAGSIVGFLIMVFMGIKLGLHFTLGDIPMLILLSLGAVFIYGGLFIVIASSGFWVEGSLTIIPILYNLSSYGRYPINIFRGFIRFVLTWVVPFAFVGFYPAAYFLRLTEFRTYSFITPVIGAVFFIISYFVWLRGLRRYQGTGS